MKKIRIDPRISVLMGVYYRREDTALLRRSVESILSQSLNDFEFLICDDGSIDPAKLLLEDYARRDRRIRLIRPGDKLDLASKLNACLRQAGGVYIARMDDDDYSHPERFKKELDVLEKKPEVAFVGCNVRLCVDGKSAGERVLPAEPGIRDFYFVQPYIHPSLMFRREVLEAVGGYSEDPRQRLCEDYDLLLRLCARGFRGENIQETLLDYSIPASAKGNRNMIHRWNETVTRYARFRELGVFPGALAYVIKPLAVGLIPERILKRMKESHGGSGQAERKGAGLPDKEATK